MLSIGVLAAIGLNWLLNRIHKAGYNEVVLGLITVGILAVVGLEFLVVPYPMSFPETQPFHYQVGREPESYAVMDIPMDWDRPANLLHQTVHQKPTVSGYTSRTNPLSPAWRTPVLQTFRYLGPDINVEDPRELAPTVLADLNVRYVVVHKNDLPPGDYRETTLSLADEVFGGWPVVVDDDWLKVFQVPRSATSLPYLMLGEGWAPREWRDGGPARALADPVATLGVRLPQAQTVYLEITAYSLDDSALLEMWLDGKLVSTQSIGLQPTVVTTPFLPLPAGESVLQIRTGSAPGMVIVRRVSLVSDQ
jgi:hypothetical protein